MCITEGTVSTEKYIIVSEKHLLLFFDIHPSLRRQIFHFMQDGAAMPEVRCCKVFLKDLKIAKLPSASWSLDMNPMQSIQGVLSGQM